MNTMTRSKLPRIVILALVVLSTLVFAVSLASLHVGKNGSGYSVPVLFNQANADAAHGKYGSAIANYERAHLLAPGDPDITANLNWTREHAGLTKASTTWIDNAVSWASPNTMSLFGWLGLVLAGTGALAVRHFGRYRIGFQFAAFTGIILVTLSATSAIVTWQKLHEAVIVGADVAARISPVSNGETSFKLHPGEMVSITGHYHDFALVRTTGGNSGWVAQSDITPLIPTE